MLLILFGFEMSIIYHLHGGWYMLIYQPHDFKWTTLSTSFDYVLNSCPILLCHSIKLIEAIYLYLFFVQVFVSKHW